MGSQQLYVMEADGSNVRRISYGEGRYATPVWSPRGDLIAFTKTLNGRFLIGVMKTDGSGERILTEGYHNEGPAWSPNGRVIAFSGKGAEPIKVRPCGQSMLRVIMNDRFRLPVGHPTRRGRL